MARVHLLTQAYGSSEIRAEALYCAWSALAWADGSPLTIHVFTDEPAAFAPLAPHVCVEPMSPEQIRAWRGPEDFVHRLKVMLIRDAVARFPDEKLLYVDADAFFTGSVSRAFERIGPGRSVMHSREYSVATHATSQMQKFRRHMGSLTFRNQPIDLTPDMWNAGAVGLDPTSFGVVPGWLEFIDAIYPRYPRGLVEQYWISLALQRQTVVTPIDDVLFHYWFQKDDYQAAIGRALETLAALPHPRSLEHLRAHPIRLPYRRRGSRLTERIRRIWSGRG
jgi:hypothetical protein